MSTFILVPTFPRNVTAISTHYSALLVSWEVPIFPPEGITKYVITYYPFADLTARREVTVESTSFRISNLKAYTSYSIIVTAFTFALGDPSAVITARTQESGMII